MVEGVDVSRHQGDVNWKAAKATSRVAFAYIKLTEGVGYVDPRAGSHINAVRRGDVTPGVYHFARPDTNSGGADADHFCAEVLKRGAAGAGWLPPCLDLEERTPGSLAGIRLIPWVSEWVTTVRRKTKRRQLMLYASTAFLRDRLGGLTWLDSDVLVWVAHYGRNPGQPGFRDARTVMHQYTQSGRIAGFGADIDRDICWVDLKSLTGGRVPAPPPVAKPTTPVKPGALPAAHVVAPGENLSSIAEHYNIAGGWQALYRLNRDRIGADPDVVKAGVTLRLRGVTRSAAKPAAKRVHVVAPGESLSSIAAKYHVDGGWRAIYDANRKVVSDPDHVETGWKLVIP